MENRNASAFSIALSRFSNALSGLGAIFLLPIIVRECRFNAAAYLADSIGYEAAYWASWGVVGLIALCVYFGGTALFQALIYFLMKPRKRQQGGF